MQGQTAINQNITAIKWYHISRALFIVDVYRITVERVFPVLAFWSYYILLIINKIQLL